MGIAWNRQSALRICRMFHILPARMPHEVPLVRELFREYLEEIGIDLAFQSFDEEVASLPGKYAPPSGRLLLGWDDQSVLGCVALREIDAQVCEIKRLYVRPRARARHLGRELTERILQEARAAGYTRVCLDTLPEMVAARRLYGSLGFVPIEPYVFNPLEGAIFLGREL
jgi:ribosomal protein S18 acetylase RimI-like enzyme